MIHRGKQLIKDMLIIIVASVVIGLGINLVHPRGFILVSKSDYDNRRIVAIATDEAKIKYDSQVAVFIDAREKAEYGASRIAGAVNIPAGDVVTRMEGISVSFLSKPVEIIVYCDGVSCQASNIVARKMLNLTPRHIYILEKGFPDWAVKGYPVEGGE